LQELDDRAGGHPPGVVSVVTLVISVATDLSRS
jgi:hypothetical protein